MGSDEFESMVQALLEDMYRIEGDLIQFGPGQDGAREATWSQSPSHATYKKPPGRKAKIPREWVFQVKYHDMGVRGWSNARDAVVSDLESELTKIVKYKVPCHSYVLATNVPFTGALSVGTRDRVSEVIKKWRKKVPQIFVWDAADISRMLDASESVRTAYLDAILPGDVLKSIYANTNYEGDRRKSALRAYLLFVADKEGSARAEEAGDDPGLPLADVFIDLQLTLKNAESDDRGSPFFNLWQRLRRPPVDEMNLFSPRQHNSIRSSFALMLAEHDSTLLLGGPGVGKSTLTQFLSLYQAARAVNPQFATRLAKRLQLPKGFALQDLDAHLPIRYPFRIELRRYAKWISDQKAHDRPGGIADYIAAMLINVNVSGDLNAQDVFGVASTDPILLILDGLDEVPNVSMRAEIIEQLQIFMRRARAEGGNVQLLISSRPKNYYGEFDAFDPMVLEINELGKPDFDLYCKLWLDYRIRDAEERREASERIERGMKSEAVQRLGKSLLQATVMLTIVRRKSEIPHQRHALYAKYVDVIFDREKEKWQIVRERATELLRLHERVGYELHAKMELSQAEALDTQSFRQCVLSVLEDYSASELGAKTIREVADEIIGSATDRLCLLAGKGQEQADFDFVVQTFREYFAAAYLFNHPDADPDRVFDALVRRGAYWSNVLQFYVAQANAAQQMRWVAIADGNGSNSDNAEEIRDLVRLRRALLSTLPEFSLQRKGDFERALKVVCDSRTRWVWADSQVATDVLRVVRSGAARKSLLEFFARPSTDDPHNLQAELSLLSAVIGNNAPESDALYRYFERLIENDSTRDVAVKVAVQHDVGCSLEACSPEDLAHLASTMRPSPRRERSLLFECQTVSRKIELLVCAPTRAFRGDSLVASVSALGDSHQIAASEGFIQMFAYPYWATSKEHTVKWERLAAETSRSDGSIASYIGTLCRARLNPDDSTAYHLARESFAGVAAVVSPLFGLENVVGPPPTAFESQEAWSYFKKLTRQSNASGNLSLFADGEYCWAASLLHPSDWYLLSEEGLIPDAIVSEMSSKPTARALAAALEPIEVCSGWAQVSGKREIDLVALCRVALRAVSQGPRKVSGAFWFGDEVFRGQPTWEASRVEQLLDEAELGERLPSVWRNLLLNLAVGTPNVTVDRILGLWKTFSKCDAYLAAPNDPKRRQARLELLSRLIKLDDLNTVEVVAAIAAGGEIPKEFNAAIHQQIVESLKGASRSEDSQRLLLRALMSLEIGDEECQIWEKYLFTEDGKCWRWLPRRLMERIAASSKKEVSPCTDEMARVLGRIVSGRPMADVHLRQAAVDALIRSSEVSLPPLKPSEWQISGKSN